jgi:hypothetical protein
VEKYKHIYDAFGLLDAEQIKIFLESEGIDVMIAQESAGQTLGLTVGPLGTVKVYVHESQVDMANKLLDDMQNGKFDASNSSEDSKPEEM